MMVVFDHIEKQAEEDRGKLENASAVEVEVSELLTWSERRADQVSDVEQREAFVPRLFDEDGKIIERGILLPEWPLEGANKDILPDYDMRIAGTFRRMKVSLGVNRPSFLSYVMFRDAYIHKSYDDVPRERFLAASLMHHRLLSTARIAARYDQFDRFGPIRIENEKGVYFCYEKGPLISELVNRGLMKRR